MAYRSFILTMLLARYLGCETRHLGPGRVAVIQHESTRRMALLFLAGCGLHVVAKAFLGPFSTVIVMLLGVGMFVYSSSMSRQMKDDMQHVTKVRRHAFEEMSRAQAAQMQSGLPQGQHRSTYGSSVQAVATKHLRRGTVRSCLGQSRKLPQAEGGGTLQHTVGKWKCSTPPSSSSHSGISFLDRLEESSAGFGRDRRITKTPLVHDTLQELMRNDPHEGRLQSERRATMPTSAARQRGTRVYTGRRKKESQRGEASAATPRA